MYVILIVKAVKNIFRVNLWRIFLIVKMCKNIPSADLIKFSKKSRYE